MFADMLEGEHPVLMSLTWGMVDVRDVAEAHVRALEADQAAGRYICVDHTIEMEDVVELLRDNGYDDRKLPGFNFACGAGTLAVKALAAFEDPGTRSYLRTHLGKVPRFDSNKIKRDLDLDFRAVDTTILETVEDMERWGHC